MQGEPKKQISKLDIAVIWQKREKVCQFNQSLNLLIARNDKAHITYNPLCPVE